MVKGFSESEVKNDKPIKEFKKEKKGLAAFLKGKKFTYTLPGKKQINIFGATFLQQICCKTIVLKMKK